MKLKKMKITNISEAEKTNDKLDYITKLLEKMIQQLDDMPSQIALETRR